MHVETVTKVAFEALSINIAALTFLHRFYQQFNKFAGARADSMVFVGEKEDDWMFDRQLSLSVLLPPRAVLGQTWTSPLCSPLNL